MGDSLTCIAKEYLALYRRKDELEEELDKIKKKLEKSDALLRGKFADHEVRNIRIQDSLLYLHKTLRVSIKQDSPENRDKASKVLKLIGMEELVHDTFNLNSLSARVREMVPDGVTLEEAKDGNMIPRELLDLFDVNLDFKIRVRK